MNHFCITVHVISIAINRVICAVDKNLKAYAYSKIFIIINVFDWPKVRNIRFCVYAFCLFGFSDDLNPLTPMQTVALVYTAI